MRVADKWGGGGQRERMLLSMREDEKTQRVVGVTDK